MGQISPPIRIVLVFAVILLAAWFTVLKPKDPDAAAPPAARARSSTPTTAPAATVPADSLPALDPKALEGLPSALRTGLEQRKILVLGVLDTAAKPWAPMADDDRRVRAVLRRVNRYEGAVVVRFAPIAGLARYDGLLKALDVSQSPTVVVVDRARQATALTGFVDRVSVNQAIADARRSGTRELIKATYLRKTNVLCGRHKLRLDRWSQPTVRGAGKPALRRLLRIGTRYRRAFAAVPAPKRWRPLRAQFNRHLRIEEAAGRALVKGDLAVAARTLPKLVASRKALDRRFNDVGLTACALVRSR